MDVEVVKCIGMFKPGNIEFPTDNSPLRAPSTSESISTLPKQEGFKFHSSRDGWSPARVRAADAECWAYQRAARKALSVGSAAWAKNYEEPEPDAIDEDIRERLKIPVQVVQCQGMFKPGNMELRTDSLPPRAASTSESNSTLLEYENLEVISSSRDGWSPARVRAANAEGRAWQEAADRAEAEESAAWANAYKGPEPDATVDDIRIYTKLENGEYKYWGVQDFDETMEQFWARIDPDITREQIANQDSVPLPTLTKFTPSKNPPPRTCTASSSKGRQEIPEDPEYGVTKLAMVTPASKKSIRKSLAGEIEDGDSIIDKQIRDTSNSSTKEPTVVTNVLGIRWLDQAEMSQNISDVNSSTSIPSTTKSVGRGRPRKIQSGVVDLASSNPANWPMSTREDPPKRKRGRPAKEKYPIKSQDLPRSYGSNEKQKGPKAENKAKVTKPKPKNERPIAPSIHKMRTRARGPAENLQRL